MKTTMNTRQLLAVVVAAGTLQLTACSSDSTTSDQQTPIDANGNDVPDAAEVANTGGADSNGNGVDDLFEMPADSTLAAADVNLNDVDDSFEVEFTSGTDDNNDGLDDSVVALLSGGSGSGGSGSGSGGSGGSGSGGNGSGGSTTLVQNSIGSNQGTVDFNYDGSNLTGDVTLADGVMAVEVWLYAGIPASLDPGEPTLMLSGSGSSYSIPAILSDDQRAAISTNMAAGNLYIQVNTTTGQTLKSTQILPNDGSIVATYTGLMSPDSTINSNGAAFLNFNTQSGEYAAVLTVNLDPSDIDSAGAQISVGGASMRALSATGEEIAGLIDQGNSRIWKASGTLTTGQLALINQNNGWFNAHRNDGTDRGPSLLNGQISVR